ncbi:MAG: HPP family protein [Bacillota bacterium]
METLREHKIGETSQEAGSYLSAYLCKMKGGRCQDLPHISWGGLLVTTLGSALGIGLVCFLAFQYNLPLLLPSFGASAVLLYAACHVPMAQPRNVVGGHVLSAIAGVTAYQLFGNDWWVIVLGVTTAILLMALTHTLHPPGGATSFVAVYNGQGFWFVIDPVAIGVICLVIIAVLVNNLSRERKYPDYWY